jgi:serine/threonine-protein kinase
MSDKAAEPLPLALTAAIGDRYHIERELGRGGMATVYLARDLKHQRLVALKVLDPELGAVLGAERFLSEIRVTANLQHPNLLALFDSAEANGFVYYVMPFVEGEALRHRLDREKQLPVDDAIRISTAIAAALDYAHRKGVVHRDLKPENILLHEGQPLVADFGIALAISNAGGGRITQTGLSLGTPQYMSPEQATGDRAIDARTDVYSLGAVLYEMLTGEPPFSGATVQAIVARLLTSEPEPLAAVRKSVPANISAAVHRALEKLPADRFATASAFAEALTNPSFAASRIAPPSATTPAGWRHRAALPLVCAVVLLFGAATWGWLRKPPSPRAANIDLSVGGIVPAVNGDMIVSPDGATLAVTGTLGNEQGIFTRRIDGDPVFHKLVGSDGAIGWPAFSPDNQWIAFKRLPDSNVVKVPVTGGSAVTIARGVTGMGLMHWGTDDEIVASNGTGLVRLSASGGTPEPLVAGNTNRFTFMLPDGSAVLYSQASTVMLLDLKTRKATELIKNALDPVFIETGHIVYDNDDGGLSVVPFDIRRHVITGPAVRVLDRVGGMPTVRGFSLSRNGVLVYRDAANLRAINRESGSLFVVQTLTGGADTLHLPRMTRGAPRISPDGRFVAYATAPPGARLTGDIYTFDLVTGAHTQLTSSGDAAAPVWSSDGKQILFTKGRDADGDLYVKPADNSKPEELILARPQLQVPSAWLPDGTILFQSFEGGQADLYLLGPHDGKTPTPYLSAPWNETNLQVSNDGKLAAFESNELGGRGEIWIREFPKPEGKWRISASGGAAPRWSPDGQFVYFWKAAPSPAADTLFRARVARTPRVAVDAPERLLTIDILGGLTNWDIHPDGKRVILTVGTIASPALARMIADAQTSPRYIVVLNWFSELEALVKKNNK